MSRIQNPELRIREFTFQPDALIKLTVRNFESGVTLKINDEGVSRFREPELRHSKVGVYGCSLHLDGTLVIVKFNSLHIHDLH